MKRHRTPPRYRSGPKRGQFKPRAHAAAAAPSRRRRPRARAAAPAMEAPRRRRRPRHHQAHAAAPRQTTIVVAREMPRTMRRRRRHYARAPFHGNMSGMVLLVGGGILGNEAADLLHRYYNGVPADISADDLKKMTDHDPSITTADQYNALAADAKPNWKSVAAQLGLVALGVVGAIAFPWNMMKGLSVGFAVGAGVHLSTQVVDGYIIQPLFKDKDGNPTANGKRMFSAPIAANKMLRGKTDDKGTYTMGDPARRAPAGLPTGQPQRYPQPLASTMGQPQNGAVPITVQRALNTLRDPGLYSPPAVNVDKPSNAPAAPQPSPPANNAPASPPAQAAPTPTPSPKPSCCAECAAGRTCDKSRANDRLTRMGDPPEPLATRPHPMLAANMVRRATTTREIKAA